MIEDLLRETSAPEPVAASPERTRRGRFGPRSLWLLGAAVALQGFSLLQQASYLFLPRPGELVWVIVVVVLASLVGCAGVVCGLLALPTADGRRTGVFGAALGLAFLVLFAAATSFGWGFLAALSTPV